jgi:alkylation response protein AidB-like acyl-CoA dehydrogenase/quercetin dioxygenase-like cupin family protein
MRIHRSAQGEMSVARWLPGARSALHGHKAATATYSVLKGSFEEERYIPEGSGYRYEVQILKAGQVSVLPPGSFHRLRALEDSVTLHHYTPPPETTVEEVSAAVLPLLEAARLRNPSAARPSDLLTVVETFLSAWAERETRANLDGLVCLPPATVAEMKSSGILTAPLPLDLGGWGATLRETAQAIRRLAQQAPATALALAMPLGNAATTRIPAGAIPLPLRPALAAGQQWIAEQVRRGQILAVANSEPGAGGDLANTRTTASLCDGVYCLTGRKSFATFGRDADFFLCAARRSDLLPGEKRALVDGFFVHRAAAGLHVDERWNSVGMRPTASVGLTLDNAPASALLGYPGCLEGVSARHWSTVLFAAVFLGVGEGALREAVQQAPAGAVWARGALAECALNLEAGAGFLEAVASDERWPMPAEAQERTRKAKTYVSRTAVETATKAALISGGRCYTPQHPVFRYLCDALAGPLLRPPLPQAMDSLVKQLFPPAA